MAISWASVQPNGTDPVAQWVWGPTDAAIAQAWAAHLSILITFANVPPWASQPGTNAECVGAVKPGSTPNPPANNQHFLNFTLEVAKRYGSFVRAWELWNEPDRCNYFRGTAQQYQDLILIPGWFGITLSGAPSMIVAPGISAPHGNIKATLDRYLTHKVGSQRFLTVPLEAFTFHRYDRVADVKHTMDTAETYERCTQDGACVRRYWLTEFGYDNSPQRCHICSWGNPTQGPGNAAVNIFQYCGRTASNCFKAFYYNLINLVDPAFRICATGTSTCSCDTALLNANNVCAPNGNGLQPSPTAGQPRARFTTISQYLLAHP
ncbi:MAG: hypothetical protein KIT14_21635 [bacterium]|nr:hypothetical protein [bacterium]